MYLTHNRNNRKEFQIYRLSGRTEPISMSVSTKERRFVPRINEYVFVTSTDKHNYRTFLSVLAHEQI